MSLAEILPIVIIVVLLALFFFGYIAMMRWSVERLFAPAMEHFDFRIREERGRTIPEEMEGAWNGYQVHIRFDSGGRNRPSILSIRLQASRAIPLRHPLRIRKQRWFDRLAKATGLTRPIWRGHRYAHRIHVQCEDDAEAARRPRSPLGRRRRTQRHPVKALVRGKAGSIPPTRFRRLPE